MPFTSDEQRKAAFANMRRGGGGGSGRANYGGRGGTTPKPPKPPKTPKTPKTPRPPNSSYEGSGNGYAGNFTAGLPNYANWYKSLPNTTQTPGLAPSGPWSIQGEDTFNWSGWETGPGGYRWEIAPSELHGPRELTAAEKLLIGIPVAAATAWAAPTLGLAAAGGLTEASMGAVSGSAVAFVTEAGTQGGALAVGSLSITGLPMSVNDSPSTYVEGLTVKASYPDLVSRFGAWIGDDSNDGWVAPYSYGQN